MNILYCGDSNIIDGLIISILSLLKNTKDPLHIFILTMEYENEIKKYQGIPESYIKKLNSIVKKTNKENFVKLYNITDIALSYLPEANINTRFTPFCMLRLYIDKIDELPNKILYLDNDVVCLKDPSEFYNMDITNYEITGVLDYYGSHFFKKNFLKKDYINSGVLLINNDLIKKTNLMEKCRIQCHDKKMLLPDQTALNDQAISKNIVNHIYNDQYKLTDETVFRHFTTTFKLWPTIHTQTIKPWHIDELHNTLNAHEFDDILDEYLKIKGEL